jgi:hypothetical protein
VYLKDIKVTNTNGTYRTKKNHLKVGINIKDEMGRACVTDGGNIKGIRTFEINISMGWLFGTNA